MKILGQSGAQWNIGIRKNKLKQKQKIKWENLRRNDRRGRETFRGLFITNKNIIKCDVCIKAYKQNVLTEGTNNFSTLTMHTQSNDHQLSVRPKSSDLIEEVWYSKAITCVLLISWVKHISVKACLKRGQFYFIFMDIYNNERLWHYSWEVMRTSRVSS
jgi:hypothetical protein